MIPHRDAPCALQNRTVARAAPSTPPAPAVIVTGNPAGILVDALRVLRQIEERERAAKVAQEAQHASVRA